MKQGNPKSRGPQRSPPIFEGELNEPIFAPFDLPEHDPEGKLIFGDGFLQVMTARISKLDARRKHYRIANKNGFDSLAYALACDFVPGFQVLYDDPLARSLGMPEAYYGKGTKAKGSGTLPEFLDGPILTFMFKMLAKAFPDKSEKDLADIVVLALKPELTGARHKTERERIGKTLRNRLGKARRPKR
jgi:hypothetical protein